jgi:Fur family iron response transcriptional regulator
MNNNSIFIEKLRSTGLRPTKQRIKICKVLFDRNKTFHFTINHLKTLLKEKTDQKISQATVYNTINALTKKGHLKEISINSEKNYFDTNISNHHHFFNESTNELIDLDDQNVSKIKIKKSLPGKKIKSIEVLVKIANNH